MQLLNKSISGPSNMYDYTIIEHLKSREYCESCMKNKTFVRFAAYSLTFINSELLSGIGIGMKIL